MERIAPEEDVELGSTGDARRCPVHPHVATSSPDGLFDTPCGLCELAMETPEETATRLGLTVAELDAQVTITEELVAELLDEERHDAPSNDWKPR